MLHTLERLSRQRHKLHILLACLLKFPTIGSCFLLNSEADGKKSIALDIDGVRQVFAKLQAVSLNVRFMCCMSFS